ncbi:MAG: M48 family metalloprotease [Pseudomonadota bacterium]
MQRTASLIMSGVAALFFALLPGVATAQTLVRDTEIERILLHLSEPLLGAAGLSPGSVRIRLIQDDSMNAFVTASRTIYLHSGLIERLERPDMLQSVIAHEIGHIVAGHTATRSVNAGAASDLAAAGLLAGVVLGVMAGPAAGIAVAAGSQETARRGFFRHTRAEETNADQIGVRLMESAGIDPQAAVDTLELFAGQELLPSERRDAYARTHPYSDDRITFIRQAVETSLSRGVPVPPETERAYARLNAKLDGFIDRPDEVIARTEGHSSLEARLSRAIALHRYPDPQAAFALLEDLRFDYPDDPFITEMHAQFLVEDGQLDKGIAAYRVAFAALENAPLVGTALGRSLVARGDEESLREAVALLTECIARDPGAPLAHRSLAQAHARLGNLGEAALTTAEHNALRGLGAEAYRFAKQAQDALELGTPARLRADDLVREFERYARQ